MVIYVTFHSSEDSDAFKESTQYATTPYSLPTSTPPPHLSATCMSKERIALPSAAEEEVAECATLEAFCGSKQEMNHK